MNWIIVGLGNPGEQYRLTRHNAGFMTVDALALKTGAVWTLSTKFRAAVAERGELYLVKPQTYMNLSGDAVGGIARYYKVPADRVVVVHDDLDLPMGTVKSGLAKGPKQHNGILSVEKGLGTTDFWRVRVGVEGRNAEERRMIPGQAYVLRSLTEVERSQFDNGIEAAVTQVERLVEE